MDKQKDETYITFLLEIIFGTECHMDVFIKKYGF